MNTIKKALLMTKHYGPMSMANSILFKITHNERFLREYSKKIYDYYYNLPPEKYEEGLKLWYKLATGEDLDLENPRTFNEKVQWLKLYDSTPIKTRLADKYLVRDWVREKIGEQYLIPLLGVWNDFDEIDFDQLPNQFVLKANHGCGCNIIVKDKSKFDVDDARKKFEDWMDTNFAFLYGLELQYMNIQPKIIAEKYMEELNHSLYDYKIHCFDGKPVFIQCIGDRNLAKHTGYQNNYDLKWNKLDWIFEDYPHFPYVVSKPKLLDGMVTCAEKLSEGISYVRVDLYEVNDHIYFGEMTFTPASGSYRYKGLWTRDLNIQLGNLLQLPSSIKNNG